jgi:hypothetical protein
MKSMVVTLAPERGRTRVLMKCEEQDVLKAVLPSPELAHPRAAATLLEGLALWHQTRLSVVLLVDDQDRSSAALSLYDGLGLGDRTLHYEVAVACREPRRARSRIDGVGDFRDLRQLRLEVD